jgi:hypothetical protein
LNNSISTADFQLKTKELMICSIVETAHIKELWCKNVLIDFNKTITYLGLEKKKERKSKIVSRK